MLIKQINNTHLTGLNGLDEPPEKIFDEKDLKQNRLSKDQFEKNMDGILRKGLIPNKRGMLRSDQATKMILIKFFNENIRIIDGHQYYYEFH